MGWDLTPSASERHHGFTIADKWCRYTCAYRDYQGRTHCPPNRCICATKSPTPSPTPSPPTPSPTPSPTPTAVALHEEVELRLSESSSNIEASAVEPVRTGETPNGPRYMFLGTATELIKVLRDTPAGGAMNVVKRMALSGAGAKDCVALQVEAGADGFVYAAVSLVAKSLNVGHASVAAVLKIRKADLQVVGVHKFDQSSNMAYSLAMDADFLYSGQYTYPGRIVKMAKDSMSVVSTLVLEKGQDDVRWIFKNQDSSSQRLFVLTNTAPGIVLEVDTAGAMKVLGSGQSLGTGYDHPLAGVAGDFDEDFLYAGTNTYPGRVVKVSKRTLRPVSTLTLPKGHDTVVALQSDGVFDDTRNAIYSRLVAWQWINFLIALH